MPDFKQTNHSSRARYLSHFDKWTVAKGEDLWRRRLVQDWQLESSRRLSGQVSQSADRLSTVNNTKVLLDAQSGSIRRTECTCSRGSDCEHAVALLITFLDTTPARVAASVSSPVTTRTASSGYFGQSLEKDIPDRIIIEPEAIALSVENLHFDVTPEENWWFKISMHIEVGGKKIPLLPILLKALREKSIAELDVKGKFICKIDDGTIVSLPFERISVILKAVQEVLGAETNRDFLHVSVLHAAQILQEGDLTSANFCGAEKIIQFVELLQKLERIELVDSPQSFAATLRDYQRVGLTWLHFLAKQKLGGILADDMGLGKTVQLIAHLCLVKEELEANQMKDTKPQAPFLVVCPTSVLPNWLSECQKFAPHLKTVAYHGTARDETLEDFESTDLIVTTYPILTRDVELLSHFHYSGIALDEAQTIKNHGTKLAHAARQLKAQYRFCLTGTPVENHLGELWSQFEFLLPGLLGDQSRFRIKFRNPIEKEGNSERKQTLAKRIKPFLLRRTKQEVAKELPDKTTVVQKIELSSAQKDLYETVRLASTKQVREQITQNGFNNSHIMILDALLKLRQVCGDPRLVNLSAARALNSANKIRHSAKLEELLEKLSQLVMEGRKILVFSQFTSMLSLIAEELKARQLEFVTITGDTKDRKTPVDNFQNGMVPIFLISLKAGGTGLNLTAADIVIHYDPWWNPAVEEQATDRAHRIGQTKKVFVYKLIARGTIEEKMLELQERKRELANSIYDKHVNLNLAFDQADLEELLAPID
ncbi:MAG: DEAD/DEAH box helicase [Candidatus Obscuribacterales bacterium]|nr:DEAD/DEAH box helicase [Candidatus Obscuribacterales bacterium]